MKSLDETDIKILQQLQNEGRVSNAKLAEKLAMSEASCWRRMKRLNESGVISGVETLLERRALGFDVLCFVQLSFNMHSEETTAQFEKMIQENPNVLSCHNITGEADFLLKVVAKDLDDYSRFIDTFVRRVPGITSIRSNISLRELKSSSRLPLEELEAVEQE